MTRDELKYFYGVDSHYEGRNINSVGKQGKRKKLNLSLFVCCLFFLLLLTMYCLGEGEVGRARIPGVLYKCVQ